MIFQKLEPKEWWFSTGLSHKIMKSIDFHYENLEFLHLLASKNWSNFMQTYSFRTSDPVLKRPWPETFKNRVYYCKIPPEISHRGPSSWPDIGKIHFHHPTENRELQKCISWIICGRRPICVMFLDENKRFVIDQILNWIFWM